MKKKITLCMVLSTFIICAMLCLTNCSNDDAPTSVFTPEALKQTTWQAQMTVYNIEDEIDYTKQSILQFTNESEGIYTRDFDSLRLETDAFGHSVITGVFLQDKLPIWREATTKSVGKYIAFVFNDTVITAPQVNSPIESGCFQISNPHGYDLERIFRELQKEIDISRFGN